jgi:hypothetical protein
MLRGMRRNSLMVQAVWRASHENVGRRDICFTLRFRADHLDQDFQDLPAPVTCGKSGLAAL